MAGRAAREKRAEAKEQKGCGNTEKKTGRQLGNTGAHPFCFSCVYETRAFSNTHQARIWFLCPDGFS